MNARLFSTVGGCALALSFSLTQADILSVTQDTYSNGITPSSNFGSATSMRVRDYGPNHGFIEFDLSSLSGSTIDSATLIIEVLGTKKAGDMEVRLVTNAWSENTLTFDTAPGMSAPVATFPIATGDAGGTVSVDLRDIVQGWADGTTANYGLALTSDSINVTLGTKEGGQPATLDVTASGGGIPPTDTRVSVPGDFDTIQEAIDGAQDTWCPSGAAQCVVIVGPGEFEGFTGGKGLTIVGAGQYVTKIGPISLGFPLGADSAYVRDLTIASDPGEDAVYCEDNSAVFLYDVTVLGGRIHGDTGCDITASNMKAGDVTTEAASLNLNNSDVAGVEITEFSHFIGNSRIQNISMIETNVVKIVNSYIEANVFDYEGNRIINSYVGGNVQGEFAALINTYVQGTVSADGSNVTNSHVVGGFAPGVHSCINVTGDWFEYLPDCTAPAP